MRTAVRSSLVLRQWQAFRLDPPFTLSLHAPSWLHVHPSVSSSHTRLLSRGWGNTSDSSHYPWPGDRGARVLIHQVAYQAGGEMSFGRICEDNDGLER
jgi:hypothetical protein